MKHVFWPAVAGALVLIAWCALSWLAPHSTIVEIEQDGRIVSPLDLRGEKGSRTITLNAPGGGFNTLLIENGRIRVVSADCPGHDCVRMGVLRSASAPLVCLPHRLIVRFAPSSAGELDGVSQ